MAQSLAQNLPGMATLRQKLPKLFSSRSTSSSSSSREINSHEKFELAAKNVEIDQLKQQTAILQTECETVKSSTTEMSNKPTHEANQKFHSSVEHQPQHLRDQCIEHDQKVKHLEAKLESERQNHAEKVKILQEDIKKKDYRIAELEEAFLDQIVEAEKVETARKQAVANYQLLEKDHQKLTEDYNTAKKLVEDYENRLTAQKATIIKLNSMIQRNDENATTEIATLEASEQALQAQLQKALDPLENIEEIKEVVDLEEEIGRGAYGVVKKVSLHGTICAAKDIHVLLINYASDEEFEHIKKTFLEECIKCSKLFHPNIVQFLGTHYPSKQAKLPWLFMELLDCSLTGFVKKYDKEDVSLFVKASIFSDISLGLQFLHGRNIIHRDLSSNNILLTQHLTAKIGDLGVAKVVDPDGSKSHTVAAGTRDFLPPDVFSDAAKSHYGKSIDVFSLGCVMIHVTTHEWPVPLPLVHFSRKNKKVVLTEVKRREAYLNQIRELQELKVLIENCLHDVPKMRPSVNKMVDDLGKLRLTYQKNSGNEINAVEFEKSLKLQAKTIEKLNETMQDANKLLQVACFVCHKCKCQFKEGQLSDYKCHIDNCHK